MRIPRFLVRTILTAIHRVRRLAWAVTGSSQDGVHALAVTDRGTVVLVRLSYVPGWRLPGGGRKRGEPAAEAMLRELREEIGLTAHDGVERLEDFEPVSDAPGGRSALFRVRGTQYRPRRSFEIEEVGEYDPADLPDDTTPWTRAMVARYAAP